MKSLVEQIFTLADHFPTKIALIEGKTRVTYKELKERVFAVNLLLVNTYRLCPGDRIVLSANKQLGFVYLYFASHLSEITVIPIDSEINSNHFDLIVTKTAPKLIVGFHNRTETCPVVDLSIFEQESKGAVPSFEFPEPETIADIIFTTGTTGLPKGVVLTQRNISASAHNINTFIRNSTNDVELLALPISHSFGLGRLRCVLSLGGTLVLLGSFVNMKRFYRLIEEYHVSGLAMVPSSWAFLKKMSGLRLADYSDSLHYIEMGSAPMSLDEKNLLMSLFPHTRICMHYGLTEASRSAFIEFHQDANHLYTVGKPTPNVSIAIKDENGYDLPFNVEGEICVRGESVMKQYWKDPEITSSSFFGDYFRTGDWGEMDDSGYLILQSRKKELINVGGKKVSPVEVEAALLLIIGIQDCACIGIADPNGVLGEVVKAFVVKDKESTLTVDILKKEMENKLEAYKLPVVYEWIDSIPKTSSGKIQRLLLKQ